MLNVCVDQASPTAAMDARVGALPRRRRRATRSSWSNFVGMAGVATVFHRAALPKWRSRTASWSWAFPLDLSDPKLPPEVEATAAYASTGFVLVRRGGSKPVSLE